MSMYQNEYIEVMCKPDITIRHNDVEILVDRNVVKKEVMKIIKYKELTTEIQRKCNVKKNHTSNNRDNWKHLKI
jgi:hypothetical protein